MHPLVHLAIIWAGVFAAVVAAKKTRLTPVLFFLFIGFVLVNAGILPDNSSTFIREFAELGIIFIMFALGFEESTDNFLRSLKRSWGIAFFGAVAPFGVAYMVTFIIWQDVRIAMMCALAMTATAVSLTMVSLKSVGLQKSVVATRIMTSAVIDDIAALIMVAIVVPIAAGDAVLSAPALLLIVAKSVLFFALVSAIGAWIFPCNVRGWFGRVPLLGRLGLNHILSFDNGKHATLMMLLLALVVGLLAMYFGFHPAVGAYMAGLITKEEYFRKTDSLDRPDVSSNLVYLEAKATVDNAAFSWVGPVFFVDLGAKLVFDVGTLITLLPYALILTSLLIVAQVSSAGLAARYTGGMSWPASLMVGFGMLGRAELAFVVMDIAYIQNDILPTDAFITLMITAFFLNIAVPISIDWWKPYYQRSLRR